MKLFPETKKMLRALLIAGAMLLTTFSMAQDDLWLAGRTLRSATESTGTMTLVTGAEPGVWSVPSINAEVRISLTPETAEAPAKLRMIGGEGTTQQLESSRIRGVLLELRELDPETFIAEVKSSGREGALVSVEVRSLDDNTTSTTVTTVSARPVLIVQGERDAKILQVYSHNAFRMKKGNSSVIVAPLDPSGSLFMSLSSRERTWQDITGAPEPERAASPFSTRPGR